MEVLGRVPLASQMEVRYVQTLADQTVLLKLESYYAVRWERESLSELELVGMAVPVEQLDLGERQVQTQVREYWARKVMLRFAHYGHLCAVMALHAREQRFRERARWSEMARAYRSHEDRRAR